jgi:hypothetical protein
MKRVALALAIAAPLFGCGPSFPTIDKAALLEAVAQVRVQTIKVSSYIPSDESLIAILTTELPMAETALSIAQQICAAVTASVPPLTPAQMSQPRLGDANPCPMVRGTCITGQFLADTPPAPAP